MSPLVKARGSRRPARSQKPQAAGRQEGSGLAGAEPAVLSGLADTGGQQSQQQHRGVSPASEQGQHVHCLCAAQAWPLARELPLSGGAEGPGACLPTMPTLLGSLPAADSCGERGLPQSGAYRGP